MKLCVWVYKLLRKLDLNCFWPDYTCRRKPQECFRVFSIIHMSNADSFLKLKMQMYQHSVRIGWIISQLRLQSSREVNTFNSIQKQHPFPIRKPAGTSWVALACRSEGHCTASCPGLSGLQWLWPSPSGCLSPPPPCPSPCASYLRSFCLSPDTGS